MANNMHQQRNNNIAIFSPSPNALSETFIHAHKNNLKGNIYYFHTGFVPIELEGGGSTLSNFIKIKYYILKFLGLIKLSLFEYGLKSSLLKHKISIVLAEFGYTGAETWKICKECNIPMIVHFHGGDSSHVPTIKKYKEQYKLMFEYATSTIAVSQKMVQSLLELGCLKEKLIYNPYGPSEKFFEIYPELNGQRVLYIGRFIEKKAPYYLILAFFEVLKKFPNAELRMGGEGLLLGPCMHLTKYLGIEKSITFLGPLNHQGVIEEMKHAFIFAQHSITSKDGETEGTPVSILEAQAAGLPVVSTYHAGIGDVVQDYETGFLVEEHDVKSMAKKVIEILENPGLAKKMSVNAKHRIRNHFSLEKHINTIDQIIEDSLKDHAG